MRERIEKVFWLTEQGILRTPRIARAMLRVPREDFIPEEYRDYAYIEAPFPLPGSNATISCPHSYPLFYEALELREGDQLLEVGAGSGYGAALAREIVGERGRIVTMEIDRETYEFAKGNLERAGYMDVLVILGDGSMGYPPNAPYDKICITASCPRIPERLIRQLNRRGKLMTPMGRPEAPQDLVLLSRREDGKLESRVIERVLYVPLRGKCGFF